MKHRAAAFTIGEADLAAEPCDDFTHDAQAQPVPPFWRVSEESAWRELAEYLFAKFLGNAGTLISHGDAVTAIQGDGH